MYQRINTTLHTLLIPVKPIFIVANRLWSTTFPTQYRYPTGQNDRTIGRRELVLGDCAEYHEAFPTTERDRRIRSVIHVRPNSVHLNGSNDGKSIT